MITVKIIYSKIDGNKLAEALKMLPINTNRIA